MPGASRPSSWTSCAARSGPTWPRSSSRPCAPDWLGVAMPSFDAVSELDTHELTNAVDQANRELSQRFDFKDTGAEFELKEKEMTVSLKAPAEFQLKQMVDILAQRLSKRGIDVRCMDKKDPLSNLAEAR